MADSVLFDGVDDSINVSVGAAAFTGALTCVAIAKQTADTASLRSILTARNGGGFSWSLGHDDAAGKLRYWMGSEVVAPNATWRVGGGWSLGGVTKTAGTTAPRFHTYNWATATWLHEDAGSSVGNFAAPTNLEIAKSSTTEFWNGSMLIIGVWNAALADGDIETLITGLQSWYDAAPVEGWRLDRLGGIGAFRGPSSEQSRTGTTLDVGDVPAGWDDSLTIPGIGPSLLSRRYMRRTRRRLSV